jgi:hypothetical protein
LFVSRTPNPRVLQGPGKFSAGSTSVADPAKVFSAQLYRILPTPFLCSRPNCLTYTSGKVSPTDTYLPLLAIIIKFPRQNPGATTPPHPPSKVSYTRTHYAVLPGSCFKCSVQISPEFIDFIDSLSTKAIPSPWNSQLSSRCTVQIMVPASLHHAGPTLWHPASVVPPKKVSLVPVCPVKISPPIKNSILYVHIL